VGLQSGSKRRRRALVSACIRLLAVCSAAVVLFAVVLWPSRSFAAIVPACEADFVSSAAPSSDGEAEPSCDRGSDDDIDNSRLAPMCDARGASAIAPPHVRNIRDVRFDRHRPCKGGETLRAVSPGQSDPPTQATDAIVERAVIPSLDVLVPAGEARLLDPLARADGPRAGVRRDVYHPPR
jgi:hypothetical protein